MRTSEDSGRSGIGEGLTGQLVGGPGKPAATFGAGRVCEEDGCTTRLSIYNSRTRCSVHDFDASLMNFRCPTHVAPGHTAPPPAAAIRPVRPATRVTTRPKRRPAPAARKAA